MSKEEKVKKPKSKASKIAGWIVTGLFAVLFVAFAAFQIDGMVHKNDNFGETIRFGVGSFVVQTDSMEPDYAVDSAIITFKEDPDSIYERFNEIQAKKAIDPTYDGHIDITFKDIYDAHVEPYDKTTYTQQTQATNIVMTHRLREIHVKENVEKGQGKYTYIVSGINISEHQSQKGQYQAFTEKYLLGVVQGNSKVLGGFFKFISSPWGLLILLLVPALYLAIASIADIFKAYKDSDEKVVLQGQSASGDGDTSRLDSIQGDAREKLKQQLLQEMMREKMAQKATESPKEEQNETENKKVKGEKDNKNENEN